MPLPAAARNRLAIFAADIKIQHTVFALPWALLSAVLAGHRDRGSLTWGKLGLVLICMVTARTVAMGANRIFDAELDAKNPRTSRRALPSGRLSRHYVAAIVIGCGLGFIAASAGFWFLYANIWPLALSIPVLAFLSAYPFLKRWTELCHYYLGAALALAPLCAWVAISGRLDWPPLIMFAAVLSWTAGFDILYACQDYASDIELRVHSVPARLGIGPALWVSRGTHFVSAAAIVLLGVTTPEFGWLYAIGAAASIALLAIEQSMVRATDLSKVNVAFFTINGIISVLLGSLGILDILRH
ncbi:MAG: UbiA-like polyprenyltransferase [Tepidisphaeraceae bacterium]